MLDTGCSESYLASDEGLTSTLTLMVEENARAAIHVVGLTVFLHYPKTVLLGYGIRTVGVERRVLVLWHFFHLAVKLAGTGLIDAARIGHTQLAHGL